MTSRWEGAPLFRGYGREPVSILAISLSKRGGGGGGYRRTRSFSNVRMTRSLNPKSSENIFFLKLKPFVFKIGGKHFRTHATIAVHHLFCEALHFWSLRPLPETATERKTKLLPDGKSHGLDIQQQKMQKRIKENLVPTVLGQGDPPFRNRFSQNVLLLPLS